MSGRRRAKPLLDESPETAPQEETTAEVTTEAVVEEATEPVVAQVAAPALVRVSNPSLHAPEYVPLVSGLIRLDPKGFTDALEADLTDTARQMNSSGRLIFTSL